MACGTARGRASVCLLITIAAQIGIAWFVHESTKVMEEEWPRKVKAHAEGESVRVVHLPQFWGPINMLVPKNCSEAQLWRHVLTDPEHELQETIVRREQMVSTGDAGDEVSKEKEQNDEKTRTQKPTKAAEASDKSKGSAHHKGDRSDEPKDASEGSSHTERRLRSNNSTALPSPAAERALAAKLAIPFIQHIPICHQDGTQKKQLFHGPTPWNRYFSMISLSSILTGGTKDVSKLAESRRRTYWGMFVGLIATMFMKYSLKLMDIGAGLCGHKYVQLWNGGRTTIDKMIESIMIHGISIVFTLSMQLTLCTVFLTFWQGEYFVMSYIPGIGFVAFLGSFMLFTIYSVCDRVKQIMLHSSNCYIVCFWIGYVIWMAIVTVPMLGYSLYVLQYAFEIHRGNWIRKEPFSEEFVQASHTVIKAVGGFTAIAVIEFFLIIKLDLEEGKAQSGIE